MDKGHRSSTADAGIVQLRRTAPATAFSLPGFRLQAPGTGTQARRALSDDEVRIGQYIQASNASNVSNARRRFQRGAKGRRTS